MDIEHFWQLIEESRRRGFDGAAVVATKLLQALPLNDILIFEQIFLGYMKLSYRARLWCAFYLKEGGCGDDAFDYMRYGLIAAGRQTFDEVVVDPDQLANDRYAKFFFGHEDFGYVAKHAFDKLTGATRFDSTFYDEIAKRPAFDMESEYRRLGLDPSYRLDDDPVNKLHHEDADALRAILPNVWRRFGFDFDSFWYLIEQSRKPSLQQQDERLRAILQALTADEILTFQRIFTGYMTLSERAPLWLAFKLRTGACDDVAFDEYRQGLIAAGRKAFDELVADPDRLADERYADIFFGFKNFRHVAKWAYETKLCVGVIFEQALDAHPMIDMEGEYQRLGLDPSYRPGDDPIRKVDPDGGEAVKALLPNVWRRFGPPS